jgi:pyruvate/oxaloacetate carboxyltransferase
MIVMRLMATTCLLLSLFSAHAEGVDYQPQRQADVIHISHGDGLVTVLPAQNSPEVLRNAQTFLKKLMQRQTQYAQQVEKTRFKTQDTLITIIMPGGLLYAANKQHQHANAKAAFDQISQQLDDFNDDLAGLKTLASRATLASLR